MTNKKDSWMYAETECSDSWGFADSREEAIAEGRQRAIDFEYDSYVVAKADKTKSPKIEIAEIVLEQFEDYLYDRTNCEDYLFSDATKEHIEELNTRINHVLKSWMREFKYEPNDFYVPIEIESFTVLIK